MNVTKNHDKILSQVWAEKYEYACQSKILHFGKHLDEQLHLPQGYVFVFLIFTFSIQTQTFPRLANPTET